MEKLESMKSWEKWRAISVRTRTSLGQSSSYKPLTASGYEFCSIPKHRERIKDCLEVGVATLDPKTRSSVLASGFYVDTSQCVSRKRWSTFIKTLCQGTTFYDVHQQRYLTGMEHLALMGWPLELLSKFEGLSEHRIRSVAGEGMFAASIAAVLLAVILNPHGRWWASESELPPPIKRQRIV